MINFLKNLFGVSIRSKVMKAVEKKISDAQKACDSEIAGLTKSRKETIADLNKHYVIRRDEIAERHVNNILSKLI